MQRADFNFHKNRFNSIFISFLLFINLNAVVFVDECADKVVWLKPEKDPRVRGRENEAIIKRWNGKLSFVFWFCCELYSIFLSAQKISHDVISNAAHSLLSCFNFNPSDVREWLKHVMGKLLNSRQSFEREDDDLYGRKI